MAGRLYRLAEETKAWHTNLIWSTGLVDYALRLTKSVSISVICG